MKVCKRRDMKKRSTQSRKAQVVRHQKQAPRVSQRWQRILTFCHDGHQLGVYKSWRFMGCHDITNHFQATQSGQHNSRW